MTTTRQRETLAVVTAVALLAAGLAAALIIDAVFDFPPASTSASELGVEFTDRDLTMAWIARVLLFFAVAWVLIGMIAARTRLVGRPGAAAARVSWIASSRPWRARESTLGLLPLDRWLLVLVPGALLVATRAVQTSFLSWSQLAIVFGASLAFAGVVRLFVGQRSPWPILAAVGGVVVVRCILALAVLSFAGPSGYWFGFWTDPVRRTIYITVAVGLFLWSFVAGGWALSAQLGARRATGALLAGVGAGITLPAAIIATLGVENVLSAWDEELGLFPWDLTRITGVSLEIPDAAAGVVAIAGVLVAVVGIALALSGGRRVSVR